MYDSFLQPVPYVLALTWMLFSPAVTALHTASSSYSLSPLTLQMSKLPQLSLPSNPSIWRSLHLIASPELFWQRKGTRKVRFLLYLLFLISDNFPPIHLWLWQHTHHWSISKQINLEIKIIFGSLFCVIPTPPALSLSLFLSPPLSFALSSWYWSIKISRGWSPEGRQCSDLGVVSKRMLHYNHQGNDKKFMFTTARPHDRRRPIGGFNHS